eukprot:s2869_g4.t1
MAALRAALSACVVQQRWAQALHLARCGGRDAAAQRMALLCLARAVQWARSLGMLEDMHGQRLPLTETAYLAAISASQAVRNWQVATQLFWKAQRQGVAGAASCGSVILSLGRAQHWAQAQQLLGGLGRVPETSTYNAVMFANASALRWEQTFHWFQQLHWNLLCPNHVSFSMLLRSCTVAGKWQAAFRWLSQLQQKDGDNWIGKLRMKDLRAIVAALDAHEATQMAHLRVVSRGLARDLRRYTVQRLVDPDGEQHAVMASHAERPELLGPYYRVLLKRTSPVQMLQNILKMLGDAPDLEESHAAAPAFGVAEQTSQLRPEGSATAGPSARVEAPGEAGYDAALSAAFAASSSPRNCAILAGKMGVPAGGAASVGHG